MADSGKPTSVLVPAAALAAIAGASAAVYWPASQYGVAFVALCTTLLLLAAVLRTWRSDVSICVLIASLAMGHAALAAHTLQNAQQHWRDRAAQTPVDVLHGHVVDLPDREEFRTRFVLREAATGQRVRMSWYDDAPDLRPGQCWQLRGRLRDAHGSVNAGGFDYEQWLFRERLVGSASVRGAERCADDRAASLDRLRDSLSQRLRDAAPTRAGQALIPALVVGDRRGLSDADWTALRRTGTSHLVAISGLHIGLLAVVGYVLGAWLWRRSAWLCRRLAAPRAGAVLGLILGLAYAALSGFALPAQRALIMVAVFVACVLLGRSTLNWHALGLAAIAVLLRDPLAPLAPGFWLSFAAVGWIILIGRAGLYRRAHVWLRWPMLQLGLSLGLVPLTAVWFGEVSLLGPAVNFVLIPIFAVLVPLLLLAGTALLIGASLPIQLMSFSAAGLLSLLTQVGEWPAGALAVSLDWQLALCAGLGLVILFAARGALLRMAGAALLVPLVAISTAAIPTGQARIDVFDVGQGLSVLVRTARHALLYDAGPAYRSGFDAGEAIVLPSLRAMGVRELDLLLVSHGDGDHAGGADAVLSGLPVADRLGAGGRPCRAGQRWDWDGVVFDVLHPVSDEAQGNNSSCVLRIRSADGVAALLPGDIERSAEAELLARAAPLRSDLLVLPHHGSSSSSSDEFLAAVQPRWAVASAGYANRWGFPTAPVRARLAENKSRLLSTAHQGQLQFDLGAGLQIRRVARADAPRIWRHQPNTAWIANRAQLSSTDD